jgi:hypothetical protein
MSETQLYFLECAMFLLKKTRERLAQPELMSHEDLVLAVRAADRRLETIHELVIEVWLEKKP